MAPASAMVAKHAATAEGLRSSDRALRIKALKSLKNEIIGACVVGRDREGGGGR